MNRLQGNPVSKGYGIAKVYIYSRFNPCVEEKFVDSSEWKAQLDEYEEAKSRARTELQALFTEMSKTDLDKANIFKAHEDILDDEVMVEEIVDGIKSSHKAHDYAIYSVYNTYIEMLEQVDDALTRERAVDLKDVRNRLIRCLYNMEEKNLSSLHGPSIVIAEDLLPSDTATLDRKNVVGIATEIGGATSHTAIIAKSYGIPAVLGIQSLMEAIPCNALVILDAAAGELIINPDTELIAEYERKKAIFDKEQEYTQTFAGAEAITKDGVKIEIGMNIGSANLPELSEYADFVGLFRTEFLYMENTRIPTEEEQYEAYKAILSAMSPRPVTIRTLDIGGDKNLEYLSLQSEQNPFLGNRALRLCFDKPDIFSTQLRAALRASVHGNLWIMFPMVGSLEDFRNAKSCLEEVKSGLDAEDIPYSKDVKIGMMVEIPSVAFFADKFAKEVDFASIGTNDLCQYLFAVDRMNPLVAGYYQEFSPILFRTLKLIVDAFNKADKPISICGELGGDYLATAVLVGLGLKKLSMNTSSFSAVRRVIREIDYTEAFELANRVLLMDTESEVKDAMQSLLPKGV